MSFRIIADSCCDRTKETEAMNNITFIPLTLSIGEYSISDDENFNQDDFISRVNEAGIIPKTACPAPDAFKKAMECDEDDIYVITITDKLSGTYNSALQGKMLYEEEGEKKNIHIFNSLATSGLESLTAEKIYELASSGKSFDEVVSETEDFIVNHTALYFCLESLDVLNSNGRLYAMAASILKKIKLKLICERTTEGSVKLAGQEFNSNRALIKMANIIAADMKDKDASDKKIILSHVCCEDKAKLVAQKLENVGFKEIEIVKASGLNSVYAAKGGLIVSYTK